MGQSILVQKTVSKLAVNNSNVVHAFSVPADYLQFVRITYKYLTDLELQNISPEVLRPAVPSK
jgi:hypothetical protein